MRRSLGRSIVVVQNLLKKKVSRELLNFQPQVACFNEIRAMIFFKNGGGRSRPERASECARRVHLLGACSKILVATISDLLPPTTIWRAARRCPSTPAHGGGRHPPRPWFLYRSTLTERKYKFTRSNAKKCMQQTHAKINSSSPCSRIRF